MAQLKETISIKVPDQKAIFAVTTITRSNCTLTAYNRRDFYKISFVTKGKSELLYGDRKIIVDRPALVFINPLVPYSWTGTDDEHEGFYCIFTNDFLQNGRAESIQDSLLFKPGTTPVFFPAAEREAYLDHIFSTMRNEFEGDYVYRNDLLRTQLNLILHEAVKMHPVESYNKPHNAATRITQLFLQLLERQFPVSMFRNTLQLKAAGDYAKRLAVHVNHLNAAVKGITGKNTTTHINERILIEARSLLIHSDWSVTQIANSLGFEHTSYSYFNKFFRKHTGATPMAVRKGTYKNGSWL